MAIVQDPTTSCTAYGDTYASGPGGGVNSNAVDPGRPTFAPHFFGSPASHLGIHALGLSLASDGNDNELLYFRDDQTSNGCNGWRSQYVHVSSNLQMHGISVGSGGNLVGWQLGAMGGHDVLWNPSGTDNWLDLTLGSVLNGSGTAPSALSALVANSVVVSDLYGLDATYPIVPVIDNFPGGGCDVAGDGPPAHPYCIQLYQSSGPSVTSWSATYGGSTNPGAAQLAVDKTTNSNNLYALDATAGAVWNWNSGSSSWGSLSQSICGSGGTQSVTAAEIAVKGQKVFAIQSNGGITCPNTCPDPLSIFEYTTGSGCWTLLNGVHTGTTLPGSFSTVVTDNSATYGAAVWANSGGVLYACY